MLKNKRKITNPINIIATIALITETSAAVSLPYLDNDERRIYIWLLIIFPFFLSFLFFITLNFNYRSLYAPSDFDNDQSFLKAFEDNTPNTLEVLVQPDATLKSVNLPKPFSTLYILDLRHEKTESGIDALIGRIPRPTKRSLRVFLLLTNSTSDASTTEQIFRSFKQGGKLGGTTCCITYDVSSRSMTMVEKV